MGGSGGVGWGGVGWGILQLSYCQIDKCQNLMRGGFEIALHSGTKFLSNMAVDGVDAIAFLTPQYYVHVFGEFAFNKGMGSFSNSSSKDMV